MSSALYEGTEFSNEESCPLVVEVEENALLKIFYKRKHYSRAFYYFQLNFWTFTSFVLVLCLFASMRGSQSQCQDQYTYENGYDTEFPPARQVTSVKKVKFTGGLYYDNGTLHMSSNPKEPTYVGPPSKEIDDAWEALIHDRYLAITPNEAKEVGGNIWFNQEDGLYRAGIDVLHTLHCLNLLRMSQDFDYYFEKERIENGPNGRKHIEHCINHLRQIVQCHGDMTPLPVVWVDIKGYHNGGKAIPEFDQVHTCRDFPALRKWSTEHDQTVKQMVGQKLNASSHSTK